jgi:hypothetical protein
MLTARKKVIGQTQAALGPEPTMLFPVILLAVILVALAIWIYASLF